MDVPIPRQTVVTLSQGSMVAPLTSRLSRLTAAVLIGRLAVLKTNQTMLVRARSEELELVRRKILDRDLSGNRITREMNKWDHREAVGILKTKETWSSTKRTTLVTSESSEMPTSLHENTLAATQEIQGTWETPRGVRTLIIPNMEETELTRNQVEAKDQRELVTTMRTKINSPSSDSTNLKNQATQTVGKLGQTWRSVRTTQNMKWLLIPTPDRSLHTNPEVQVLVAELQPTRYLSTLRAQRTLLKGWWRIKKASDATIASTGSTWTATMRATKSSTAKNVETTL